MAHWEFPAMVIQDPGDTPDDSCDVVFPDFPGCVSSGVSLHEAASAAAEALSLHVRAMMAAGEVIPSPSDHGRIPEWLEGQAVKVVAQIMVPADIPALAQPD
jgi:predicted RNase H-like HicB family nuclease